MAQGHSGGGWDDWDCNSPSRAIPLCQSGQSDTIATRTSDTRAHALIDNELLWGRVTFTQAGSTPAEGVDISVQMRYKVDASGGAPVQRATTGHGWHIHTTSPVDRSSCASAGGHYDPRAVEALSDYACDPATPSRCFAGDLSGKLGTVSIDGQIKKTHDASLTIAELVGLSVVLHAANGDAARIGCGDIVNTRGEQTWASLGRVQVGRYVAIPAQYARDEGRAACKSLGYHDLASIHSPEDQRDAAKACSSILQHTTIGGVPTACWIGLSDMASERGFVWMDGTAVDFTAWKPGQPDEFGGDFLTLAVQGARGHCDSFWECPSGSSEGEDAVQLGFDEIQGGWADNHYEGSAGHGADWWAEQTGTDTNTHSCWGCYGIFGNYLLCEAERPSCQSDEGPWMWSKVQDTSVGRFVAVNKPMSFSDAKEYCQSTPGLVDLASIHTAEEERMAAQACRVLGASGDDGSPHGCWIGLNDEQEEGEFVWTDGSATNFLNWAPGEPNECGVETAAWEVGEARCSAEGEDAVEIDFRPRMGGSGGWNDLHVDGIAGHNGGLGTDFGASHTDDCFGCNGAFGAYPLCETVHPNDCTTTGGTALEGSPCQFPFTYQGEEQNACVPMAHCVENTCHNDGHWVEIAFPDTSDGANDGERYASCKRQCEANPDATALQFNHEHAEDNGEWNAGGWCGCMVLSSAAGEVNFNDAIQNGGHIGPWQHCSICEISDRSFCYTRLPDNGDYRSMPWGYCDCGPTEDAIWPSSADRSASSWSPKGDTGGATPLREATSGQYVAVPSAMSWDDAQMFCREHYDDLATIRSDADQQAARQACMAVTSTSDSTGIPTGCWIGLFDETRRGATTTMHTGGQLGFTWSDGSEFLPDRADQTHNWGEPTENGGTAQGTDPWMTGAPDDWVGLSHGADARGCSGESTTFCDCIGDVCGSNEGEDAIEMDFKIDLWWAPASPLAATSAQQERDPDHYRAGFIPANGHWNDDHYNGDAGHGMDSCGCFGCYVVYGMMPLCNNRDNNEVIIDAATTTTGAFTGGDPGEGHVDFTAASGDFVWAVDIGGPGGQRVGDAIFTPDTTTAGFEILNRGEGDCAASCDFGINKIADWQQCSAGWALNGGTGTENCDHSATAVGAGCCSNTFGGSDNDIALVRVLDSLRWANDGHDSDSSSRIDMQITNLRVGMDYKVQLLFQERCCLRGFDVQIQGETIVQSFSPLREQGGVSAAGQGHGAGAFISYEFVATSSTLALSLVGEQASSAFTDHNAILSGVTLQSRPTRPAHLPEEVLAEGALTHLLSGADLHENGDFFGAFAFAVNVGPAVNVGNLPVHDAIFTNDQTTPGFTITAVR
jgi:Cu/Zn superoxide dismutase